MIVWYPCTQTEFLDLEDKYVKNNMDFRLINHQHLGDEEEPMDLFEWGDSVTRIPVLRSAMTINKELFWRAQ